MATKNKTDAEDNQKDKTEKSTVSDAASENENTSAATTITTKQPVTKVRVQVLYVVAKREGFRRAGMAFGSEKTRLVVSKLTDEQIDQLKTEPMLVVTEVTEEV